MQSNAGRWRRRLVVLAVATSWLTDCVTAGFEANGLAACPPVVEYCREFQARAAEELALLPDGSTVVEMMGDAGSGTRVQIHLKHSENCQAPHLFDNGIERLALGPVDNHRDAIRATASFQLAAQLQSVLS